MLDFSKIGEVLEQMDHEIESLRSRLSDMRL
jgi:hypothetical protein